MAKSLKSAEKKVRDTGTTASVLPIGRVDGALIERTDQPGYAVLIIVQGILFDLLSATEKDVILDRYQAVLHTLTMPIQVIMQSIPMRIDDEVAHYRAVTPQYPDDPRALFGEAIAQLLEASTEALEQPLYLYVATGHTEIQARREAEALINGLRDVHPDLQPRLPTTAETLQLLRLCLGLDDGPTTLAPYQVPWAHVALDGEGKA